MIGQPRGKAIEPLVVKSDSPNSALETNGGDGLRVHIQNSGQPLQSDEAPNPSSPKSPYAASTVSSTAGDGTLRSVRKSVADVKLEGWLFRESAVLSGVVNLRFAAVLPHAIVSFRDPQDDAPTKVWPLDKDCKLSPVVQSEFSIRKRKRNLVIAFATRHFHRKQLSWFTLQWPPHHIYANEPLKLCFKEAEEAETWRLTLTSVIEDLGNSTTAQLPQQQQGTLHGGGGGSFSRLRRQFSPNHSKKEQKVHGDQIESTATHSPGAHVFLDAPAHTITTADQPVSASHLTNGIAAADAASQAAGFPAAPIDTHAGETNAARVGAEGGSFPAQSPAGDASESSASVSGGGSKRKWASFRHVCGVAIYQEEKEERGEEGGATMVSTCIRSSPEATFQALMNMENSNHSMAPFLSAVKLEDKSSHTRVIKGWLHSNGWPSLICAPREAVVEQHWRQEEDGTFIVFMSSVRHHAAREAVPNPFSWYRPIRAKIIGCTYSLAPLQPELATSPPECLLTMVLKVQLGGWLGVGLPAHPGKLCQLAAPLMDVLHGSFLDPLLLSVITLRDCVEQDRFTVKPFSLRRPFGPADMAVSLPAPGLRRSSQRLPEGHLLAPRAAFLQRYSVAGVEDARRTSVGSEVDQHSATLGSGKDGALPGDTTPTLDPAMWSFPGSSNFKLRGKKYLSGDKSKTPAGDPMFELAACDLTESDELMWNVGRFLPSIKNSSAPFTFVLNFMVPGPPYRNLVMSWAAPEAPHGWASGEHSSSMPRAAHHHGSGLHSVPNSVGPSSCCSFGSRDMDASSESSFRAEPPHGRSEGQGTTDDAESDVLDPFDICLARFLEGHGYEAARRRNARFKLIPHIIKASWVVKGAVGSTPVLLGKKLLTKYYKGERYFEVDVDISSSLAASSIANIVKGATKSMVIDFAVVIEGHSEEELPERLLGTCRFSHLDLDSGMFLDHEGKLHHQDAPECRHRHPFTKLRGKSRDT